MRREHPRTPGLNTPSPRRMLGIMFDTLMSPNDRLLRDLFWQLDNAGP